MEEKNYKNIQKKYSYTVRKIIHKITYNLRVKTSSDWEFDVGNLTPLVENHCRFLYIDTGIYI